MIAIFKYSKKSNNLFCIFANLNSRDRCGCSIWIAIVFQAPMSERYSLEMIILYAV